MSLIDISQQWRDVCADSQVSIGRGAAALIDGVAIALFRAPDGDVFAVSNIDPASGASVMSRGLVGSVGDVLFVASPMFKHRFNLVNGVCLDHGEYRLNVYPARIVDGVIEVSLT